MSRQPNSRLREVAPKSVSVADLKRERRRLPVVEVELPADAQFPNTRGECKDAERPCPWVRCRYHLYLDVSPRTGTIKLNFPDLEVDELTESCALDVADRGDSTLTHTGDLMNVTRERARQIEEAAGLKVARALPHGRELLPDRTEDDHGVDEQGTCLHEG